VAPRAGRPGVGRAAAVAEQQAEALKELGHWSRWLVAVESALLAGIVAAGWLGGPVWLLIGALVAFSLSLASATMVLGAIPDALQRRPIRSGARGDIYAFVFKGVPLRWWARGQHLLAGAGLAFLFGWAMTSLAERAALRPPSPARVIWVDAEAAAGAVAPRGAGTATACGQTSGPSWPRPRSRRVKASASSCSQSRNARIRRSSPRSSG
jgi:hypothetical protein